MRTSEEDKLEKSPQMRIEYWLHIFKPGKNPLECISYERGCFFIKGSSFKLRIDYHLLQLTREKSQGSSVMGLAGELCVCAVSFCIFVPQCVQCVL